MQIEISVLNVEITEKPGKTGTYKMAEVSYKDLGSGKVQAKKLVSFGKTAKPFLVFASNNKGNFTVEQEKDGDFWVWTSATPSTGKATSSGESTPSAAQPASKFQEDKDKVQQYIVRQSSLKAAVDYLGNIGNKKATIDDVVSTAAQFEAFVFDKYSPDAFQEPKLTEDDIPY